MPAPAPPDLPGDPSPVVLLLPGMTLNRTVFPAFKQTTICPDFNSFDQRVYNQVEAGQGMLAFIERLDEWLRQQEAWENPNRYVVSHSFGGMLALAWLAHHRCAQRIKGLVLISTSAGPMYETVRPQIFKMGQIRARMSISRLVNFWSKPRILKIQKQLLGGRETKSVDFRAIHRPTDFRVGLAGWKNTDWQAIRSYRLAMQGFDIRDQLSRLSVPTIVLHGTNDSVFPTSVGKSLAESLPEASLELVVGAEHVLPLTHPNVVVEAVNRLLF